MQDKTMVPVAAISKVLADAMQVAVANGANSISMPDEYVAVAHFVAYPEQYTMPPAVEGLSGMVSEKA